MDELPTFLISLGLLLIASSLIILTLTFFPVLRVEINYQVLSSQPLKEIKPIDTEFGVVVPKIGANSRVIANVDPYKESEYQWALTKGVAHAKGTALPGQKGNVFLFSHSSVNFYEASRYNAIFYLLNKLQKGDEIDLYYRGGKFKYFVKEVKVVDPKSINYLLGTDKKEITLMTCTPPGTNLKRLLVIGELLE